MIKLRHLFLIGSVSETECGLKAESELTFVWLKHVTCLDCIDSRIRRALNMVQEARQRRELLHPTSTEETVNENANPPQAL